MKLGSGAFEGPYSFSSRFEEGKGTNPEELIGAAEAGCYSMALSANLEKAGHPAKRISTTATVKLEMVGGGPKITTIDLKTEAEVPGIDEAKFREQAELTKKTCPVSVALAGTQINLDAKLLARCSGARVSRAGFGVAPNFPDRLVGRGGQENRDREDALASTRASLPLTLPARRDIRQTTSSRRRSLGFSGSWIR